MAFLGLKIPPEAGDLLSLVDVPETREPKDRYHVTILNLGKEVPLERLAEATLAAFSVTSRCKPFKARTRLVSSFTPGDDGVPIFARVESAELHQLWDRMKSSFDAAGIEYSKKFPEFVPHITLAYAKTKIPDKIIPTIEWTVNEVVLWGGDKGENRVVMSFPLEASAEIAASLRVAARCAYACGGGCGCACKCNEDDHVPVSSNSASS